MITTNMRNVRSFQDIEMASVPSPIARNADKRRTEENRLYDENNQFIRLYGFVNETGYAILHTFFLSIF